MYKYEITKYNSIYRDGQRRYLRDEWTAISDIGKTFIDGKLTQENYKIVEDSYIKAILTVMQFVGTPYLVVNDISKSFPYNDFMDMINDYKELYTKEILDIYLQVKNMDELDEHEIDNFCRLLLREDIGAKVFYKDELEVYIGYDYLMSIHSKTRLDKIIPSIEQSGLFVEKF